MEQRLETTLSVADFVVDSFKSQYKDEYIKSVFEKIRNCKEEYEKYKNGKMIKKFAGLKKERQSARVHREGAYLSV